jgi:hypothetical protein
MNTTQETVSFRELTIQFCELLDEIWPAVQIGSIEFNPSDVLRNCDPIAFHCELVDWISAEGYEEVDDDEYIQTNND